MSQKLIKIRDKLHVKPEYFENKFQLEMNNNV